MDTIYALASARGRSGVAVIRVSGPKALEGLKTLTGLDDIPPRRALFRPIHNPVSRGTVDHALVIGFPGPHSFTGEDTAEYHVHGGTAVIAGMLDALKTQPGHRLAEPGEFTRRAFENGKMDLTGAEGLADLINAETQLQKEQALAQMDGALSRLYEDWRERLIRILAHVEADLEFPDEDLPEGILPQLLPEIEALAAEIAAHLNDNRRGEILRDGVRIAVIGAPNAGKSSLVNALTQRDIAIVSETPGTTRDVIEAHLDIGGYPVILFDTAGLRPEQFGEQGTIENEGIRRALARAQEADLKILLYDGTADAPDAATLALEDKKALPVLNKADAGITMAHPGSPIRIAVKTGEGLPALLETLSERIETLLGDRSAAPLTRPRHREALEDCRAALRRALDAALPELTAEDLRLAIRHLGRIGGRVDVEDLLDVVFRDFCLGK